VIDVQEGKVDDARKRYEKLLAKDSKNEAALLALADLTAMAQPNPEETRGLIERAIAANPRAVRPRLALVGFHLRQKDSRAALTAAQGAQASIPDDPQVLEALALAQLGAGETNSGLETLQRIVKLQPQNAAVLLRIGAVQLAAKDYAAAAGSARRALALQPDLAQAWSLLVRAQMASGQTAAALAEARKLQKDQPTRAIGFALEGEILWSEKKFSEAAAAYRLGLGKQSLPALAVAAYRALRMADKPAEATAFADMWLRDNKTDTALLEFIAQQDVLQKDYAAAITRYRAVLAINPDHAVALNNLAWLLGEKGDPAAREYAEHAYRLAPLSPAVIDTLGWTLYRTGEVARGTQLLRLAANLAPGESDIQLHFGTALAQQGDKEGAQRVLERLSRLPEGTPARVEAEKLLGGK
jgi:putative PEP-CTERM system TPR-repeat lipoprotein